MDGERISYTERILNAIEYGKLPSDETERRLCALIEAEVTRTDSEADMELIKACQSLMWQLHSHGETPYDSHYDANKAKIAQRLHRGERFASAAKSVGRIVAAAAAVVLVVLGLRGDLQWSWLEHDDTADQQQHIISANEVGVELIQKAIAEHGSVSQTRVTTPAELTEKFSFIPMPQKFGETWEFSFADISVSNLYICVDAQYVNVTTQSTVIYTTIIFTDAEEAYYTFEQSASGESSLVDDYQVYVATNMHRSGMCWTDGLAFMQISGEFQEEEGILIIQNILKEWYK